MLKRDLLEKIKDLKDDEEIVIAVIVPKDDEDDDGFEMGEENPDANSEDDDEISIDNGDGTVTDVHEIQDVEIVEDEDSTEDPPKKFATLIMDMTGDDEDEDEEEDHVEDEDKQN